METFMKGAAACRPLIARNSLAETLIDPALAKLREAGATVRFGARIRRVDDTDALISAIHVDEEDGPGSFRVPDVECPLQRVAELST